MSARGNLKDVRESGPAVAKRSELNQGVRLPVLVKKSCTLFQSAKQRRGRTLNDFENVEEFRAWLAAFKGRCVVSGLTGEECKMSVDRKIDTTGR